jgi:hypothetical protein
MKYLFVVTAFLFAVFSLNAQKYPEPEFSNEVYYLKKDSIHSLTRLEKESSKMDTKTKAAGFGGAESGYAIEGTSSSVRLASGKGLSFIISTGANAKQSSQQSDSILRDSMLRAQGIDPSMASGMPGYGGMNDPSTSITLYKADASKGQRKIYTMKMGGAFSMGKNKSSDKYTFSAKKIREGYWELVIDKSLPKGEYAFAVMGGYSSSAGMDALLYAFGVD